MRVRGSSNYAKQRANCLERNTTHGLSKNKHYPKWRDMEAALTPLLPKRQTKMRARAVIGANFGDCGKGLLTDYLCATQGAGMVIRFNGGAQAGHTVVTPSGLRHVFHHFGSGVLCGVPTFLSQFFICNPLLWRQEVEEFARIGLYYPELYVHPNCLVTTFADMVINQQVEDARGDSRHGSVGVGVNETIRRSELSELRITVGHLWKGDSLEERLRKICGPYAELRCGKAIENADGMIAEFQRCCEQFANYVSPLRIQQCKEPVFEGAQGLLLDQDNREFFPYVTHSHTGMRNVRILCQQAGIDDIDIYYVSRTYLTRHGAGPLPGEDAKMRFADDTNLDHPYQGLLRFAPLNAGGLLRRCKVDADGQPFKLVLTHCDQLPARCSADLFSYGPTRNDVFPRMQGPGVMNVSAKGEDVQCLG